jgi:hypothetical protein
MTQPNQSNPSSTTTALVLDRNILPHGPDPRRGVPQARHCMYWPGGNHGGAP